MADWREQYERMKRWHQRVSEPMRPGERREEYNVRIMDYFHAFFVTCRHLQDWLEKDKATGLAGTDQVYTHIKGSPWLSRCIEVANASKHLKYGSPGVSGGSATRSESLFGVPGAASVTIEGSYFYIEGANGTYDAMQAAAECLREWDVFLGKHGLM